MCIQVEITSVEENNENPHKTRLYRYRPYVDMNFHYANNTIVDVNTWMAKRKVRPS